MQWCSSESDKAILDQTIWIQGARLKKSKHSAIAVCAHESWFTHAYYDCIPSAIVLSKQTWPKGVQLQAHVRWHHFANPAVQNYSCRSSSFQGLPTMLTNSHCSRSSHPRIQTQKPMQRIQLTKKYQMLAPLNLKWMLSKSTKRFQSLSWRTNLIQVHLRCRQRAHLIQIHLRFRPRVHLMQICIRCRRLWMQHTDTGAEAAGSTFENASPVHTIHLAAVC